jgi:hypothetical protein
MERTTVAWQPNAAPYEVVFEESVPTSRDQDPVHRIRIRMPGRPDFIVVDDRGPGPFVAVHEALRFADPHLVPRDFPDSARLLLVTLPTGGAPLLFAFGYAYASDPFHLIILGLDRTGYPRLLFHRDFDLEAVADVDGDGRADLVGRATVPQGLGQCAATYDPFAVYRLGLSSGSMPKYDLALSRTYNLAHYVWAGPKMSETIEVRGCPPEKLRLINRRSHR